MPAPINRYDPMTGQKIGDKETRVVTVRMPPELHERLKAMKGASINQFCVKAIEKALEAQ